MTLDLPAETTIRIPALGLGAIPHAPMPLPDLGEADYWIVRLPYVWERLGLFVDTGPVDPTVPLRTLAFNYTNKTVKIPRGMAISRLQVLPRL